MSSVHGSSRASGYTETESTWSPSGGKTAKASNHHSTSLYAKDDLKIDKEKLHAAGNVWGYAAQQAGAYQS